MINISVTYWKTPYGELILGSYDNKLCLCDWRYRKMREVINRRITDYLKADFKEGEPPVLQETKKQLTEYFEKTRKEFTLPLLLAGTEFQKSVWKVLMEIPYGTTTTYKDQAEKLKNPGAIRAVASANGANALALIIPCHRVIGSNGHLTGYAGGIKTKEKLLDLECHKPSLQLPLF